MATEIRKQGRLGNQWQTVKVIDSPPCSLNGLVSPGGEESEPGPQPFVTVSLRPLNLYPWLLFNYVAPRAKFTPVSCSSRKPPLTSDHRSISHGPKVLSPSDSIYGWILALCLLVIFLPSLGPVHPPRILRSTWQWSSYILPIDVLSRLYQYIPRYHALSYSTSVPLTLYLHKRKIYSPKAFFCNSPFVSTPQFTQFNSERVLDRSEDIRSALLYFVISRSR